LIKGDQFLHLSQSFEEALARFLAHLIESFVQIDSSENRSPTRRLSEVEGFIFGHAGRSSFKGLLFLPLPLWADCFTKSIVFLFSVEFCKDRCILEKVQSFCDFEKFLAISEVGAPTMSNILQTIPSPMKIREELEQIVLNDRFGPLGGPAHPLGQDGPARLVASASSMKAERKIGERIGPERTRKSQKTANRTAL
jgi:hypothetical protein